MSALNSFDDGHLRPTSIPDFSMEHAFATSNLTDVELFDGTPERLAWEPERLRELTELRRLATATGESILVRWVFMEDGRHGYVYGLTVTADWPRWRARLRRSAP